VRACVLARGSGMVFVLVYVVCKCECECGCVRAFLGLFLFVSAHAFLRAPPSVFARMCIPGVCIPRVCIPRFWVWAPVGRPVSPAAVVGRAVIHCGASMPEPAASGSPRGSLSHSPPHLQCPDFFVPCFSPLLWES